MRIISTRKFRFYTEDRSESFVTEGKNIIQDCPDWAKKDAMFQCALGAGLIQILSSASALRKAENEKILPQNAHEAKALLDSQNEVHMDEGDSTEEPHMDEDGEPEAKETKKRSSRKRKTKE